MKLFIWFYAVRIYYIGEVWTFHATEECDRFQMELELRKSIEDYTLEMSSTMSIIYRICSYWKKIDSGILFLLIILSLDEYSITVDAKKELT